MKPLLLLTAMFFSVSIYAQEKPTTNRTVAWEQFKAQEGNDWKIRWNEQTGLPRVLTGQSRTKYRGTPEVAAKAFLVDNKEMFAFKKSLSDLRHVTTKENRGVFHVTFQQYSKGLKVEAAQYKVHIREDGTVDMANGYYYDNIDVPIKPSISSLSAINTAMSDLELSTSLFNTNTSELLIYPQNEKFILAYKVEVIVEEPFTNWQYFIDAKNGTIIEAYNKVTSFYPRKNISLLATPKNGIKEVNNTLVTGVGHVYPKHPGNSSVTTKNLYGLDGNGKLDGTYVRAKNSSSSDAYSSSHSFLYSASNTHFDEVSLYYHVDNFRRNFIEGLDSGNNLFNFIEAHAHNNTVCNNNACYNPNDGDIYFSDGYDYAKEDKVIYHEYSHKVVRDIESGIASNVNGEEGAISEGTPDYFAGSFTNRALIGDYAVPMYKRDMNNPLYSSYSAFQSDNNDGTLVGSHIGGEFFSSILWDIRNNSGITTNDADFLVFDALFRISGNPDFLEFRDAMMSADTYANSGVHRDLIQNAFAAKGVGYYVAPTVVINGPDEIDANTAYVWTSTVTGGSGGYTYEWTIDYFDDQNPTVVSTGSTFGDSFDGSSTYFDLGLRVTYPNSANGYQSKSITVDGGGGCIFCKKVAQPTTFSLSNNYPNPFNPSTQIKFELPEMAEVSIKVYNIVGQEVATLVNEQMQAGFHNTIFEADNLASGVYIARLIAKGTSGEEFINEIKMQLIK